MPLRSAEFADFGGLDLRDDAQRIPGAAVDTNNVLFDQPGRVRTRDGTALLFTAAATPDALFAWRDIPGSDKFVFQTGTNVYTYSATGTNLGSTATALVFMDFVAYSSTAGYLATPASGIRKITDAGVLTAPAGMPTSNALAIQTPDNRLVSGFGSRVSFSDPNAPETFGANNYVDINPSAGDSLSQIVSWNNLTFVFQQNGFFVFYGNSVDSTGNPVFNYRKIAGREGISYSTTAPPRAVAADDGVYFVNFNGVWKTTGGPAVKISDELDPLFYAQFTPPYYTGLTGANFAPTGIARLGSQLLVKTGGFGWLLYDLQTRKWSRWSITATHVAVNASDTTIGSMDRFVFVNTASTAVTVMQPGQTSDNGTAIPSLYRSGFWSPGQPGSESTIREFLLDGTGTVNFANAVNDNVTLGSSTSLALGTAPQVAQNRDRRSVRGRNVSWQVSASSGLWSLSRLTQNVRGQLQVGLKTS